MERGLSNGDRNLCFQNSVLQCLLRILPVRRHLEEAQGTFPRLLRGVAGYLDSPSVDARAVELFREFLGRGVRARRSQEDPAEFLRSILERLEAASPTTLLPTAWSIGVRSPEVTVARGNQMLHFMNLISNDCPPLRDLARSCRPATQDFIHVTGGVYQALQTQAEALLTTPPGWTAALETVPEVLIVVINRG